MWSFRKEIHKYGIGLLPDPPCDKGMDVAFLIDYTGSMGPVIEEAKSSAAAIAAAIEAQSNPNSYRLALVISDETNKGSNPTYNGSAGYVSLPAAQKNVVTSGPSTNQYNTAMEIFGTLDNEVSFTAALNTINTGAFPLGSGVGGPEPLDIALDLVVNNDFVSPFRINKAKYVLIFTDNLPGGNDDTYTGVDDAVIANLTQDCIDKKIKVFVLGQGASHPVWQNLAINTGGNYNLSFDGSVIISQIVATCQDLEPPVAIASPDETIDLPTNSVSLNGTSSYDTDGTIVSYLWQIITGPGGGTFSTPMASTTNFSNLQEGVYNVRLTVTDNDGLSDTDFVTVTVENSIVDCDETISFSSDDQAGRYCTEVQLGAGTGTVVLNYNAGDIPDRFQIEYNGTIVADSLYVGDYLTGNPPDADTALWEGGAGSGMFVGKTYNGIPEYEWDGTQFVTTGNSSNYTVTQSDVAPSGQTAGAGTLSFVKTNANPSTMKVIVTALPANTGFDFTPNCPAV